MSNFEPNAIARGAQLTLVGGPSPKASYRALQNPRLFTSEHYRQAALAVVAGLAISLIVSIPTVLVRIFLWILSLFMDLKSRAWDDEILKSLVFIENSVLQVPFFLMTFMKYISPAIDNMFMESLQWVDQTYVQKHKTEDPKNLRAMYHPNLVLYGSQPSNRPKRSASDAIKSTLYRYGKKAGISLLVLLLSQIPYAGRLVLPAATFYSFNKHVGFEPAVVVFGTSVFLPRRYLVTFLQSFFASRNLMRDLLDPYFKRVYYTPQQKRAWFRDREGVLFGFGVGFFILIKIPLVGVLIYGIAEASTAYLITKITDPLPPPAEWPAAADQHVHWSNKHEFMRLPLDKLEAHNVGSRDSPKAAARSPSKQFT